ncbi:hypothetical protein SprV_0501768400 [Sparganum proliferum]
MGLFDHKRIHESGIGRSLGTPSTSCTSTTSSSIHTPPPSAFTTATISETNTDIADFPCPHHPRTFASHIGLVGHLRTHLTETGEPVTGAPTYTRHIRLNCSHCTCTFTHRTGRMQIYENLR